MSLFCISILLLSPACVAYVGPGPGLSMLWALIGLAATLLAAFSAIAILPIRILRRRWREQRAVQALADKHDP